jgi:murein DD-endopeptidase MepM/ murein hydrolase activator NlpD
MEIPVQMVSRLRVAAGLALLSVSCGDSPTSPSGSTEACGGFGDWRVSPYSLPYAAGLGYPVEQGNCSPSGNGHRGAARFGYDFTMAIGTPLTAARGGVVIHVEESHSDGQVSTTGFDNFIVVAHADGTTALYGHLTRDGALVDQGVTVQRGEEIGRSGNTGNTSNRPHLHFSVHTCDPVVRGTAACASLPVNFQNTEPNPNGLSVGRSYVAGPVEP